MTMRGFKMILISISSCQIMVFFLLIQNIILKFVDLNMDIIYEKKDSVNYNIYDVIPLPFYK